MLIPTVIKMLSPKIIKGIINYVFEENELDLQMKATIEQVANLTERVKSLENGKS